MARFEFEAALQQGGFGFDVAFATDARAVVLFGPSGSGKTTALELLAGLRSPHRGRVAVSGHVLVDRAAHVDVAPQRRRVGYVPQDVLLFPHLDVRRNVQYGHRPGTRPDEAALIALLELEPLLDRSVASLSGGERQRVAIARALYSAPDVLLLDEPLAAVDLPRRARIAGALMTIRDELNVPLVYVTHSPDEAKLVAEYAVVLEGGRKIAEGKPEDVLSLGR